MAIIISSVESPFSSVSTSPRGHGASPLPLHHLLLSSPKLSPFTITRSSPASAPLRHCLGEPPTASRSALPAGTPPRASSISCLRGVGIRPPSTTQTFLPLVGGLRSDQSVFAFFPLSPSPQTPYSTLEFWDLGGSPGTWKIANTFRVASGMALSPNLEGPGGVGSQQISDLTLISPKKVLESWKCNPSEVSPSH